MCNWGDKTLLWYELWGLGGVRLATWPRDRLGYFQQYDYPRRPAWLPPGQNYFDVAPHLVTCPLRADGPAHVYVNADGLDGHTALQVEVLDERFRPLPALSGDACLPVQESGLRVAVRWRDHDAVAGLDGAFRLQITFAGLRPEDARLYAVYVATAGDP
jgi:hypothetical protein